VAQGVVPGISGICDGRNVAFLEDDEADGLGGVEACGGLVHLGDGVTLLNTMDDSLLEEIVLVVFVGHAPLIAGVLAAGLKDTEDFAVSHLELWGVNSSLDGEDGVEGGVSNGHLVEVTLDEGGVFGQAILARIGLATLDLVGVVVETSDVCAAGRLDDLAEGTTDTAADIQNFHSLLQAELDGEVGLMAVDVLLEGIACENTL